MQFARLRALVLLSHIAAAVVQAQQPMQDTPMMQDKDMKKDMQKDMKMGETATYTVVLRGRWTAANFPLDYPAGAHFSGLIGATHSEGYHLFREGMTPSAGLERLSEMGNHQPLDGEIQSAASAGRVGMLVTTGPLKDFGDSVVTTITVDAKHPLVSLVAMIAPSPDWFAGVASVDLRDMGSWAANRTVVLMAYDSGGDDGTTYAAPDRDASPKRPTMIASRKHFAPGGKAMPVATITFVKQ
jgi:hypothetical protein